MFELPSVFAANTVNTYRLDQYAKNLLQKMTQIKHRIEAKFTFDFAIPGGFRHLNKTADTRTKMAQMPAVQSHCRLAGLASIDGTAQPIEG